MKGRLNLIMGAAAILLIIVVISGLVVKLEYDRRNSGLIEEIDYSDGTYYHDFQDFGPGTFDIEAEKILMPWEKKKGFSARLFDEYGDTIHFGESYYMEVNEGGDDGNIKVIFGLDVEWQVLRKGNYRLEFDGLRKDSRDSLHVITRNTYTICEDDFSYYNKSFCYRFQDEGPAIINISVLKVFPGGATRGNIEAELLDENDECLHKCSGLFMKGTSIAEAYGLDENYDPDEYGDYYRDIGMTDIWVYIFLHYHDDYYVIDRSFFLDSCDNVTLRLNGLRTNSEDTMSATIIGNPPVLDDLEVQSREFPIDDPLPFIQYIGVGCIFAVIFMIPVVTILVRRGILKYKEDQNEFIFE